MSNHGMTPDEQVIVLLCSALTLMNDDCGETSAPLSAREWHELKRMLKENGLESPSALMDLSLDDLTGAMGLDDARASRLSALLKRGGQLAIEIENLSQLGIWVMTEYDESYPLQLSQKLGDKAPPVLFGAGDKSLVGSGGLAIVGSRNLDESAMLFTDRIAKSCADERINVISGAARGVDGVAMLSALRNRGNSVGVLADSLEKFISSREFREFILEENLAAITHVHPRVGFSIALAMSRNKFIYALSDWALVVSSDREKGGTWAGATEALRHGLTSVFVRDGEGVPDGNKVLLEKGAIAFPEDFEGDLREFLEGNASMAKDKGISEQDKMEQMDFGF